MSLSRLPSTRAHLYLIRWISYHSSSHLFYNPSSVFDTMRFNCVFIQALESESSCKSISGCLLFNGLLSHLSYPPPQGSSVLDTTTGSSLPGRYQALFNPGYWCVYSPYFKFPTSHILVYLSFLFRNIYTALICIDTMRTASVLVSQASHTPFKFKFKLSHTVSTA
jgi:hypothetical protein